MSEMSAFHTTMTIFPEFTQIHFNWIVDVVDWYHYESRWAESTWSGSIEMNEKKNFFENLPVWLAVFSINLECKGELYISFVFGKRKWTFITNKTKQTLI